jgi:Caudovirus prohead protease.
MSKTSLGDETLELCSDGILDASAAFRPLIDGKTGALMETWTGKELRRLEKVWLGHVALTPNPAYQDAKVLSVRSEGLTEPQRGIPDGETPNLARARALRLQDEYDLLSR